MWHWRRGALKLVFNIDVHTAMVRAMASGGDMLFTGSDDHKAPEPPSRRSMSSSTSFAALTLDECLSASHATCSKRLRNL